MNFRATVAIVVRTSFVAATLIAGVATAVAQAGRGSISGLVTDPSGAIVPGASVIALEQATGVKLSTVSTDAGVYSFVSLAPGKYQLTATAKGFETLVAKNIMVTLDQVTTANLKLTIGGVNSSPPRRSIVCRC